MVCHPKNALYVARWRAKNLERYQSLQRIHQRVYHAKKAKNPWPKISINFLKEFRNL